MRHCPLAIELLHLPDKPAGVEPIAKHVDWKQQGLEYEDFADRQRGLDARLEK